MRKSKLRSHEKSRGTDPVNSNDEKIDREYIEGETPREIGKISEQKNILDKSKREPSGLEKESA